MAHQVLSRDYYEAARAWHAAARFPQTVYEELHAAAQATRRQELAASLSGLERELYHGID